jgi:phenylpropionate dioxygenase-like ring-hydroxylating dioxygenase large terminal subunit
VSATFLLPPQAYFAREWFAAEQRLVFGQTYNLVAYESDLPNAGDCLVTSAAAGRVLVFRDEDGGIVARTKRPDGIDEAQLAVGRWAGMVFVHPGDAPPFEEWLGACGDADKSGPFDWASLVEVDRIDVPLRCNWKLYVENHVDLYHLWYLHAESLGMYEHRNLTSWHAGPHWGCVEAIRPGEVRERPGMLPITPLPDAERPLLRANLIFPNLPMTTMETSVATFQVVPTGPETCRLDLRIRAQRGSVLRDRNAFLRVQRDEDGGACEEVQRAVRSPRFGVGSLATEQELPIQLFHEHLLALLMR